MSLFQEEVKKRIAPFMKAKGFRLRGRTYYYIKNDIAYCITFEQPTGMMYTWAHAQPLYMPYDNISLTYGNRFNDMAAINLPILIKWCDLAELENWCKNFLRCMDDNILPFFQQIDTPEKLLAYVEQPRREIVDGMISGPPLSVARLRLYTYLYLHNLPKAEDALCAYRNVLLDGRMVVSLREKLQKNADEIELLISRGDEAVSDFCEQTIANTKKLFVKSKKS